MAASHVFQCQGGAQGRPGGPRAKLGGSQGALDPLPGFPLGPPGPPINLFEVVRLLFVLGEISLKVTETQLNVTKSH